MALENIKRRIEADKKKPFTQKIVILQPDGKVGQRISRRVTLAELLTGDASPYVHNPEDEDFEAEQETDGWPY